MHPDVNFFIHAPSRSDGHAPSRPLLRIRHAFCTCPHTHVVCQALYTSIIPRSHEPVHCACVCAAGRELEGCSSAQMAAVCAAAARLAGKVRPIACHAIPDNNGGRPARSWLLAENGKHALQAASAQPCTLLLPV